jgi:hypothetical protein
LIDAEVDGGDRFKTTYYCEYIYMPVAVVCNHIPSSNSEPSRFPKQAFGSVKGRSILHSGIVLLATGFVERFEKGVENT